MSAKGKRPGRETFLRRLLKFDGNVNDLLPKTVIGIDEVGRGCLAGPVVAAAVCLPAIEPKGQLARQLAGLRDSKELSAEQRGQLAAVIKQVAAYAICEASVEEINELNILHASLLAMKRARRALKTVSPAVLLVDGNMSIPGLSDPQITVVKGDSQSASIAAASIIAKVYRDDLMCKLSQFFPHYLWHQNKGYGSPEHRQAIETHGVSPWHRTAFIQNKTIIASDDAEQLDLFAQQQKSVVASPLNPNIEE